MFRTVNVRRYYVYTMFIQYHFLHRQINFLHTHAMKHTYSKYINRRSTGEFWWTPLESIPPPPPRMLSLWFRLNYSAYYIDRVGITQFVGGQSECEIPFLSGHYISLMHETPPPHCGIHSSMDSWITPCTLSPLHSIHLSLSLAFSPCRENT